MTETKSFKEWTDEYVRDNIHKLKAPMTKYFHIVQVHPVYDGIVQTHKVKRETEFTNDWEAQEFIEDFNDNHTTMKAVYLGCVNDETGELV